MLKMSSFDGSRCFVHLPLVGPVCRELDVKSKWNMVEVMLSSSWAAASSLFLRQLAPLSGVFMFLGCMCQRADAEHVATHMRSVGSEHS